MKLLDSPLTLACLLVVNGLLVAVALLYSGASPRAHAQDAATTYTLVAGQVNGSQQDAIYVRNPEGKLTAFVFDSNTKQFKRIGQLRDASADMGPAQAQ